jgi:hypothetical protein
MPAFARRTAGSSVIPFLSLIVEISSFWDCIYQKNGYRQGAINGFNKVRIYRENADYAQKSAS